MEENYDFKADEQPDADLDPRIKFMKKCIANSDRILPIFDKIVRKTLCL